MEKVTGRYFMWQNRVISYKKEYGVFDLIACHPDNLELENAGIKEGRYLNEIDIQKKRKVAVIGEPVQQGLFKNGKDPIGEYIKINNISFQVVGSFHRSQRKGPYQGLYTHQHCPDDIRRGQPDP